MDFREVCQCVCKCYLLSEMIYTVTLLDISNTSKKKKERKKEEEEGEGEGGRNWHLSAYFAKILFLTSITRQSGM